MAEYFDKSLMSFAADLADGKIKVGALPAPAPVTPVVGKIGVSNAAPGFVVEQQTVALDERHAKGVPATRYTFGQKVRSKLGLHKDETLRQKAHRWGKAWKETKPGAKHGEPTTGLAAAAKGIGRVGDSFGAMATGMKVGMTVGGLGGLATGGVPGAVSGAAAGAIPGAAIGVLGNAAKNVAVDAYDRVKRFAKRNAELKRRAPNKPEFRGGNKDGFVKKEHEEFLSGIVAEYKLDCTNEELDYFLEEFLLADSTNNLTEDWLPLIEDFSTEAIQERASVSQQLQRHQQQYDYEKLWGQHERPRSFIQRLGDRFRSAPKPKPEPETAEQKRDRKNREDRAKARALKADYEARMKPGVGKPSRPMQRIAVRSRIRELEAKGRPTNESRFAPAFHERFGLKQRPSSLADDLTNVVFEYAELLGDDSVIDSFCTEVLGESIEVLTEQRGAWGGGSSYRDRQRNMENANRSAEISDRNAREFRGANAPKKEGLFSLLRQWIGASLKSKIKAAEARGVDGDGAALTAVQGKLKELESKMQQAIREKDAALRTANTERDRRQQLSGELERRDAQGRAKEAESAKQRQIEQVRAKMDSIDAEIEKAGSILQQIKRHNKPGVYGSQIRDIEQKINKLSAEYHKHEQQLDALHPG